MKPELLQCGMLIMKETWESASSNPACWEGGAFWEPEIKCITPGESRNHSLDATLAKLYWKSERANYSGDRLVEKSLKGREKGSLWVEMMTLNYF